MIVRRQPQQPVYTKIRTSSNAIAIIRIATPIVAICNGQKYAYLRTSVLASDRTCVIIIAPFLTPRLRGKSLV